MEVANRGLHSRVATSDMPVARMVEDPSTNATALWLTADGWVPNNDRLPLILYRAISADAPDLAAAFEGLFRRHGWQPEWRNGVYPFHHYHSTAHEVLAFAAGTARLLLGGPHGYEVVVNPGDCALLPAGTGHCCVQASTEFLAVGAYPPGQRWDLCRRAFAEPVALTRLPFPQSDPVQGSAGPLLVFWPLLDEV
jgi:uncharacterized protein YjlB